MTGLVHIFTFCATLFLGLVQPQTVEYDKAALKKLTEYRQLHRKVLDGRLCAAAFVQDDQTYTNCTRAKDPSGRMGREWCYVEAQILGTGDRDWGYCQAVVNYDLIRARARELYLLRARDLEERASDMQSLIGHIERAESKFRYACNPDGPKDANSNEDVVLARVEKIARAHVATGHAIMQIESSISQLNRDMKEIALLQERVKTSKKDALSSPYNCAAIRGRAPGVLGGGLMASYFANSHLKGPPVTEAETSSIDNEWSFESPQRFIPYEQFSIRWSGYIMAPETGRVVFKVRADCGIRMIFDSAPILAVGMPVPTPGHENVTLPPISDSVDLLEASSESIPVSGGEFYHIEVEYFHDSTRKYRLPFEATAVVQWSINGKDFRSLEPQYLFKSKPKKPLQISGLPGAAFSLLFLDSGVQAFNDTDSYFLSDVPLQYQGSYFLRTDANPDIHEVSFHVSGQGWLYVALPKGANAIKFDPDVDAQFLLFDSTDEHLRVSRAGKNPILADLEVLFEIHRSHFISGPIHFMLPHETSAVIFLQEVPQEKTLCSDENFVVSRTDVIPFDSCVASSFADSQYDCRAAFSGLLSDSPMGMWKTAQGHAVDEFISLNLTEPIELRRLEYYTPADQSATPARIQLEFPGRSDIREYTLGYGSNSLAIEPPVVTASVRLVILETADPSASYTGGSILYVGGRCKGNAPPIQEHDHSISIHFGHASKNVQTLSGTASMSPSGAVNFDDGSTKQARGLFFYGWEHQAPVAYAGCPENADAGKTGVAFPQMQCNETEMCDPHCDCQYPNRWSLDVPHYGQYRVMVQVGTICGEPRMHEVVINGKAFLEPQKLEVGMFTTVTGDITLSDSVTIVIESREPTVLIQFDLKPLPDETKEEPPAVEAFFCSYWISWFTCFNW